MSTGTILLIAIPVVLVLAALFLVVTARNSDRNAATGLLARETEKRDRARRKQERAADEAPPAAGRTLERSTALAQRGGGTVAVLERDTELDVLRPPMDAEQLGQTRRQFFNRSIIVMFLLSLGGFGGAVLAFLWPSLSAGFGAKVHAGKVDEILDSIKSKGEPFYVAEARTYLVPYPESRAEERRKVLQRSNTQRYGAGVRCALPKVCALRLQSSLVRNLAVVRMSLPRIAVQPSRRKDCWPGTSWA